MSQEDYNTTKRLGTFCKKSLENDAHFWKTQAPLNKLVTL